MNKILLVGINARYTHINPALLYLKSSIADLDVHVDLIEFSVAESIAKIEEEICLINPDILALSVYIWNAFTIKKILEVIKSSLPELKIVLGGPEVSFNSEEWIDNFNTIDFIITGAGEAAFRNLVISGFNRSKGVIIGMNPPFRDVRFPYTDDDMIRLEGRYIYYESSRGCPFNCTYCLSSLSGGKVEYRTLQQVIDELDFFLSYNPPLVKFVDRTFNLKKEHYMPIWEHVIKKYKGCSTCFHFEIFPELLDDDDIKFLQGVPAGLFQFEIGIQSTKSETLREINRYGSWASAEKKIRGLVESGNIHLHTDLIAGLPYEGFDNYSGSFNSVYSLGAEHFQCGFLKVLPGTEMREKSKDYRILYDHLPPYEIIENKWITAEEMERLKLISELVDLIHNSGNFPDAEKFFISLYKTPFSFFNRLADFFKKNNNAGHRRWEYIAGILLDMIEKDFPVSVPMLLDNMRWDWCSVMKHHHFPELLKSGLTIEAKRKGFRFFNNFQSSEDINYAGIMFRKSDLRRSIFFSPETEEFMNSKMKNKMAMFLPDKQIVFFNVEK